MQEKRGGMSELAVCDLGDECCRSDNEGRWCKRVKWNLVFKG